MGIDMNILNDLLGAQIKNTDCTCFACMVTPELAKTLLGMNIADNRPIRKDRVEKLAEEIKKGKFKLSPNPVSIDINGKLVDGQHRLSAIIMADMPAPLYVMVGVQPDSIIDRGLMRSIGDSLYMRGLISKQLASNNVIAAATRYMEIHDGTSHGKKMTDSKMAEFLSENGGFAIEAVRISRLGSNYPVGKKAGVQAAIMGAIMNGIPTDMLEGFANVVNTGYYEDDSQTAAVLLRNYILKCLSGHSGGHKSANVLCAVAEMCIQDFTKGVPRKQMYRTLKHVYINGKEEKVPKAG